MSAAILKAKRFFFDRFNSLEIASFAYILFSTVYILIFFKKIDSASQLLFLRLIFILAMASLAYLDKQKNTRWSLFFRISLPVSLVLYWYPETSILNHNIFIPNLDAFFSKIEYDVLGFFPAISFSANCSARWFSELMYFAYFSFFVFYCYVILANFFSRSSDLMRASFTVLTSFLIFYLFYIFVPVEGPMFYYPLEFRAVPPGYIFSSLIIFLQTLAEKPTAAFPSSHVAMTVIFFIEIYRHNKKVFFWALPIAILLFMSTVYIKAHYLVDVIAGFVAAPLVYFLVQWFYFWIVKQKEKYKIKA